MKSLIEDVSLAELRRMRDEERMSNQMIADSLGITVTTVRRYLGNQPKDLRKAPIRNSAVRFRPEKPAEEEREACLAVTDRTVQLDNGSGRQYTVFPREGRVSVSFSGEALTFTLQADQLDSFIAELDAIRRHIGAEKPTNELW